MSEKKIVTMSVEELDQEAREKAKLWLDWRLVSNGWDPHLDRPVTMRFRPDNKTIEFRRDGADLYYVDLDRAKSDAEKWEWVRQVGGKTWATDSVLGALVDCMIDFEFGLLP